MVRILLVEDNALIRAHLRSALQTKDWEVVAEAEDGRAAVEDFANHLPNVTVMDFVMPGMDGLQAGRRLTGNYPEAPVLMVTIDPSRQLAEEAKRAGIKGLCRKTDISSIREAIEALLKGGTYWPRSLVTA